MQIKTVITSVGKLEYVEKEKWKWLNFILGISK